MYEDDGYTHYFIRLRDEDTNEVEDITYRYPKGYDEDTIAFYWTLGNGGCDCNRLLEFYGKRGDLRMRRSCGTSRMTLLGIWRYDGEQIVGAEAA